MNSKSRLFKIAYKKLKSSLYYDKTQSILRNTLVKFEDEVTNLDKYLEDFAEKFLDIETREELVDSILSSISSYAFPKSFKAENTVMITNYSRDSIEVEEIQYFLDMDIRGHILGVLWLMLIGYRIDEKMYKHSYGNRIRKNLFNELSEEPTYSPYLFEPYFQQYESWRDKAMDAATQHLHSGQDVVILTLDFKRFYYSVDISEKLMKELYDNIVREYEEDDEWLRALNTFVYQVIQRYSAQFQNFDGRRILPIGFLPSNVLANYALKNFDQAILDGWNPIYFGRYVDDVIVVDKIEENSDLYKRAKTNVLDAEDIITFFLEQCSAWRGLKGIKTENDKKYSLLQKKKVITNGKAEDYKFVLNKLYNPVQGDNSDITIQNGKVKIFYFKNGESDALITCFRDTIAKNKSEFRHMPEDEAVFQKEDYSKIYDLQNSETINKFRGIAGISVDKFELSKLLGKHLRIGGLISDASETGFEGHIKRILSPKVIIENYGIWEKVIEILVINESFEELLEVIDKIIAAVDGLSCKEEEVLLKLKGTLKEYLFSVFVRALSLVWGTKADEFVNKVCNNYVNGDESTRLAIQYIINAQRKAYCKTRMMDKSVMPIFIDMLLMDEIYEFQGNINLCNFEQAITWTKDDWDSVYVYYPYVITMYDFSMLACIQELKKEENAFENPTEIFNSQLKWYVENNYRTEEKTHNIRKVIHTDYLKKENIANINLFQVSVENERKDSLRLAVANVRLNHNNFERVVKDCPNRTYHRYKDVSKIINEAIDEHADILVMPEAFMPFEWLSTVARTCARNNLAMVTGVEHIKIGDKIYNLSAVVLPYEDVTNKSAYISFHLKTHYAPAEKQEINGYRLKEVQGNHYELYKWHDCYFPVYCCYELTSIIERAMFQSYADFLVAIEWNKDINYYSNILESLSRDIHCYCVQVNSSDYGDSRITKPAKTEEKDIMRTKGGINSTILIDEINIKKLRDFQLKGYDLQAMDRSYKPTPPGFEPEVVLKKIKGTSIL